MSPNPYETIPPFVFGVPTAVRVQVPWVVEMESKWVLLGSWSVIATMEADEPPSLVAVRAFPRTTAAGAVLLSDRSAAARVYRNPRMLLELSQ